MKKLVHQQMALSAELLEEVNQLHKQYCERNIGFFAQLEGVLAKTTNTFEQWQMAEKKNRAASLKSDLVTLMKGYHPYLVERIEQHKRDVQFAVALKILRELEDMLQELYRLDKAKLEELEPLVQNLILAAFQLGLITNVLKEDSQADIEALWHRLGEEPNLALLQKKIVLSSSFFDAIILMDKSISVLAA